MLKVALSGALAVILTSFAPTARAQGSEEVANLRTQVELLKKENDWLQDGTKAGPPAAKATRAKASSLSDLLPTGTVLKGTFRDVGKGGGEIVLTITERDCKRFVGTLQSHIVRDREDLGTSEGEVEGVINGNRLSATSVGEASKIRTILEIRGNALEGTFGTASGNSGRVSFKLPK